MRRYRLPEGLWLSFFSIRFYQSVSDTWRARSLVYLLLALMLFWIPGWLQMHTAFHVGMQQIRTQMGDQFPSLAIVNGEVHTPEAKPYALSFQRARPPWLLIDTTGRTHSLSDTPATILVTKSQVFVRRSLGDVQVYDLSRVKNVVIDNVLIQRILNELETWVPIVIYPTAFATSAIKRFSEAFGLALLGLLIVYLMDAKLDFAALLSLAMVSLTPEMFLWTLLEAKGVVFHGRELLLLVMALGYFLFAINAATDIRHE